MKHGRIVAGAWPWGLSASPLTRWLGIFLTTLRRIFEWSRHALTVPLEVAHHLLELLLRYLSLGVPLSEYLRCSVVPPPPVPSPVAPPPAPRSEEPADCPEEEEEREDSTDPWKAKRKEGGIVCCRGSRGPIEIETCKEGEEPNDYRGHPAPTQSNLWSRRCSPVLIMRHLVELGVLLPCSPLRPRAFLPLEELLHLLQ